MNICLVCLRTDRRIKLNKEIAEFHVELCGITLFVENTSYCVECEYLLKKIYKFKRQCEKATEVYRHWVEGVIKGPLHALHNLLPPSSLGVWLPNPKRIANIILEETIPQPGFEEISSNSTLQKHIKTKTKLEYDSTNSNESIEDDLQKETVLIDTTDHHIDDGKKNDIGEEECSSETWELEQNDFECVEYLDLDIFNGTDGNIEDEPNVSKTSKVTCNNKPKDSLHVDVICKTNTKNKDEPNVSKTSKVTCNNKPKDSLHVDVISKTNTKNKDEPNVSKTSKVTCNNKPKDSLHVDVISKTNTKNKDKPQVSKKSKVTCINKGTKASKRRTGITKNKEQISPKERKVTISNTITAKKAVLEDDRLKEELILKLSSFGEIATEYGTAIDRDLVTKFLRHDAGAPVVSRLREATCREDILDLSLDIETALTTINNDWTSEDKPDYNSIFDKEYLPTLEKKLEEFQKRKTYEHYVRAKHKCEVCYQPFRGPIALDSHKITYHNESAGGNFCPICKMRYTGSRNSSNRHAETHYAVYKCKLCPFVTYYSETMNKHAEKHTGKKYPCKHCNITYNCKSNYYDHLSKYHRGSVCVTCGRGFYSKKSLQIHTYKAHREARPIAVGKGVRCDECDVTLISQSVYEAHIQDMHSLTPRPPKETRNRTQNKKQPVLSLTCRVCNEEGPSWGWIRLHFSLEHPTADLTQVYADKRIHLCDVCGMNFLSIYALREHQNVHSGSRPFACNLCSARFHRSVSLSNHRRMHRPPSQPCRICGKKFRTASNVNNHMRSHIGDRRYKCDICDKGFLFRCSLAEHVRGVHNNIRRVRKRGDAKD